MSKVSLQCVHNLAQLHNLTITPALMDLGKPEGYAQRQIEGWSKRYRNCADRQVPGMEQAMEWLQDHIPSDQEAFIHNDYKYDNLMLDADSWDIKAVLDWEMATVGHPLMDLGSTLAYWAEPQDHPALQPFSLTGHPGNLHRQEVAEQYFQQRKKAMPDVLPFYVFGCFKIGVIVQQIFARYLQGKTKDPRFANLHYVVAAFGQNIENALTYNRINNFY
jgi:aminoglycoside phosphotransferase (APT) family kinase protein